MTVLELIVELQKTEPQREVLLLTRKGCEVDSIDEIVVGPHPLQVFLSSDEA